MMIITTVLLVVTGIWLFLKYIYTYWERKGYPFIAPSIPFGNLESVKSGKRSFGMAIYDLYESTKEPFIGIYLLFRPAILIRDAELAKNIQTKDFNSFHDRGVYFDEKDPISHNLFALPGQKWRTLRAKLTPAFSSGKLKNMFTTVQATGKTMQDYLDSILPEGKEGKVIEMKDLMLKYSVDIIASTIFGLEVNSFKHPENELREIEKKINARGILATIRNVATFLCPKAVTLLQLNRFPNEANTFMIALVKKTIEFREKNNYSRKDLMQLLIQLRNTGKVNLDDTIWDVETAAENLKSMSIEQCAAQAFLFYIAGNETSASTTAYCLYELAQNPDKLIKLRKDIDETLAQHDGQITYDSIQDMKYLELCIMETVRKYPGLPILNRECTETFPIPGSNYVIEKGTAVVISVMGLHRDPKHFPDPLKFIPERYQEGNKNYNPSAYFPFGEGPRQCIALRMGKMNAKVGIVMVLTKFNIEALEKKEIEFDNYSVGIMSKGGINIKISRK